MKKLVIAAALSAPMVIAGCTTNPYTGEQQSSKTARNAVIGAAGGAIVGAVIGNNTGGGDATKGAIIGATTGGLTGGAIGVYQDRQEARLRQELEATGVRVVRNGNDITLIMPGNITFGTNEATIRPDFYATLNSVAKVIQEFDKTMVLVQGHTDSTGSDAYNDQLSVRRAEAVGNYLVAQGVPPVRIEAQGFGERQPIADNSTESGRAMNRRVEIKLVPIQA
ncbi:OmpA family protein [Parvularcula lutaonensis]|uniref:OmpA family protein n=1 Tax=Parvularcula lutaonensis TaxID=491923 RepID=A0ABV7MBT8_9PROT|nr:OmpA family protein [Parvularcula lutaonensis]GGY36372.1 OmpA family lipoprotein [Parvularcula lutaonensis]